MPKMEKDFQSGDVCFYFEDGGILRCEVVKTDHEDPWLCFKLKVLEVSTSHPISSDPEIGDIFEAVKDASSPYASLCWEIKEFAPSLN